MVSGVPELEGVRVDSEHPRRQNNGTSRSRLGSFLHKKQLVLKTKLEQ